MIGIDAVAGEFFFFMNRFKKLGFISIQWRTAGPTVPSSSVVLHD